MKRSIIIPLLISVAVWAQTATSWPKEECRAINVAGSPVECAQTGYVCHLTADVNPLLDAFAFYLGLDASCNMGDFYKSDAFPTVFRLSKIENGKVVNDEKASLYTKFFMINDGNRAGALSLTMAGSFALSAFNNSTKVTISYQKGADDTEYGGVRVKNITLVK